MDLAQREKLVHLLFEAFRISQEKWGEIYVKDVAAYLIDNGVEVPAAGDSSSKTTSVAPD